MSWGLVAGSALDVAAPGWLGPDEVDGVGAWMDEEYAGEAFLTVWDVLDGSVGPGVDAVRILSRFDITVLDTQSRAAYVGAWERVAGWVESRRLAAVVALAGPEPAESGSARADEAAEEALGEETR
jgi:hypothetical protein